MHPSPLLKCRELIEVYRLSGMPAMMRSLSSCFEVTRMWRRTERANLEKKPSMRFSHEPGLGGKVKAKRPRWREPSHALVSLDMWAERLSRNSLIAVPAG